MELPRIAPPDRDIRVIALVRGDQRYFFYYRPETRLALLRTLGRYAADPDLEFSWYDAAIVSAKVREELTV